MLVSNKANQLENFVTENRARRWVDEVRRRKGLFVREKLVQDAEKQRTLAFK